MITGASAGNGRATNLAFARCGARIGLLARGRAGLDAARRDVEAAGGKAVICQADASRADEVEAAAATLEDACGPVDVWVNNVMVRVFSRVVGCPSSVFRRLLPCVTRHLLA
jgi:NAD(P)-dependent dehydrogenase (short-subunit alcohol dehydrogenase family)